MNRRTVLTLLKQMAYPRVAGSAQERQCADQLVELCRQRGIEPTVETFPVGVDTVSCQRLWADGREIACAALRGSPSGTAEGPLYYFRGSDSGSLRKCQGAVVLLDKRPDRALYTQLVAHGAKGIITYSGHVLDRERGIATSRITFPLGEEMAVPAVNVHICDAMELVKGAVRQVRIAVERKRESGCSQNVVAEIKGQTGKEVLVSAHYDSTSLSSGAYDNLSGCLALLDMLDYFVVHPPLHTVRLLWCGSEEVGLLGSLAYAKSHEATLSRVILNVNLDMLGAALGPFQALSCVNEELEAFLRHFLRRHRFDGVARYGIRSSDSNSFLLFGVPAMSFARIAPVEAGQIHTPEDTVDILSVRQLLADMKLITAFTAYMANTAAYPFSLQITDKIRQDVHRYMADKAEPVWLEEVRGRYDGK